VSILSKNERHDTLKYEYVRRKTYDYFSDRTGKKFDGILQQLTEVRGYIMDLTDQLEVQAAELESLRLDRTSVRIAGKRDTSVRRD